MRRSHPNLFLGMLACGGWAILNGLALATTSPRMPTWMPPSPVGATFTVAGVFMLASAFVDELVIAGKVALAVSIVTSFAMFVGLLLGYGTVTASLDRPLGYLFVAALQIAPLREPTWNPATEIRRPE